VLLEDSRCPRCDAPPARVVRRAQSWLDDVPGVYEVRSCPSCGLWATSPRPRREELGRVYPRGYHRSRVPAPPPSPDTSERGTLLDVGCGVGDFLAIARSEGWRCVGVEISEEAAAVARARGFEVIVGDATEVELPQARFDRVRCAHTLEHVPDPTALLRRLRAAVAEGGSIDVVVPNRASATAAVFRRYWYHLDVPRHLFHFRPRDVRALAAASGLAVASVHHTASPTGVLGSVDCLLAGLAGRPWTRLRSSPPLRRAARALAWALARLRASDVVEYRLTVPGRGPDARLASPSAIHERPGRADGDSQRTPDAVPKAKGDDPEAADLADARAADHRMELHAGELSLMEPARLLRLQQDSGRERVALERLDDQIGEDRLHVGWLVAPEVMRVAVVLEPGRPRGHEQDALRPQDPLQVGDDSAPVAHVLDHLGAEDDVEALASEPRGEVRGVADLVDARAEHEIDADVAPRAERLDDRPQRSVHVERADLDHVLAANVVFAQGSPSELDAGPVTHARSARDRGRRPPMLAR
jgi:SAM-dependent methyltransferase